MKRRIAVPALAVLMSFGTATIAPAALGAPAQAAKKGGGTTKAKPKVFLACKHGCQFRTIQRAVNAAGSFQRMNRKTNAIVKVKPGKYVEGVVVDGRLGRKDFDGLKIVGLKKNPRKTILEGKNAKGELGPAQNGIEGIDVDGLTIRNLWARNYESNGFFVHAATQSGERCDGYTMNNLLASGNRSYGLFAKGCLGGKMTDSAGWRHGDAAFYVGETPCDTREWTNHGVAPAPCQEKPKWTVLRNDRSYENVLGYSGTNSKYVKIVESDFFNNGAGIVPNTLDIEGYEPTGWNLLEKNNVFWNNYNYFLAGSSFKTVSAGLGELSGLTINYPTGTGIILYGSDHTVVRDNDIFGNYKWGVASFSGPGEAFVANEGDDAKSINNQVVENTMGREGADPNGEYDFWNDATGGGNCWSGNTAGSTFAPGSGKVPAAQIYPPCPAGRSHSRPGQEPQPRRRVAGDPRRRKQPDDDPWLRRTKPAAEPAVHLAPARRLAPGLRGLQAGGGDRAGWGADMRLSPRAVRGALTAAVAALAATALLGAAGAAAAPKPKVVSVADFYYAPASLAIHRGGVVKWVWSATNTEPHDVHLKQGPKGLKKRASYSTKTTAVTNATFKHAFPTAGTYRFICTIHPTKMKMTLTVKK